MASLVGEEKVSIHTHKLASYRCTECVHMHVSYAYNIRSMHITTLLSKTIYRHYIMDVYFLLRLSPPQLLEPCDDPLPSPSDTDRKDTHKKVLMQLQSIFGHLMNGKLQFHIPKGFWRDFR